MRAVLIKNGKGSSDALYIGDTEKPTPKDDEVIVKVSTYAPAAFIYLYRN